MWQESDALKYRWSPTAVGQQNNVFLFSTGDLKFINYIYAPPLLY